MILIHSPGAIACAVLAPIGLYAVFLGLLTIPFIQNEVIYLNRVTLTWGKDLNIPEQWGFLHNQVSPFYIKTPDGERLHAWHILPPGLYRQHEQELVSEPSGLVPDITARLGFRLLRDDPASLLVLYLHGAAGTLASGHRPPSYRAISAGAPDRIHIVAIDYRGFGTSSGAPSEQGLLVDAVALADWATREAGVPASRIVVWSQSIGTAVATKLVEHMALAAPQPVFFSGLVLVAPFADVKTLTATYRVAGTIPLLEPVARLPRLLALLNSFIRDKWPSAERLASFVRACERMPALDLPTTDEGGIRDKKKPGHYYRINIIHAQDDYDIPWSHSDQMLWSAVDASRAEGISFHDLELEKEAGKTALGEGGWTFSSATRNGVIREDISKHGLHDWIMGYPIVSVAVMRAFDLDL